MKFFGLPPAPEMRGLNLLDIAQGKPPNRNALFGEIYAHDVANIDRAEPGLEFRWCIEDEWKLIESADAKIRELYHITADPREERDLAQQNETRVRQLGDRIKAAW